MRTLVLFTLQRNLHANMCRMLLLGYLLHQPVQVYQLVSYPLVFLHLWDSRCNFLVHCAGKPEYLLNLPQSTRGNISASPPQIVHNWKTLQPDAVGHEPFTTNEYISIGHCVRRFVKQQQPYCSEEFPLEESKQMYERRNRGFSPSQIRRKAFWQAAST